MLKEKRERTSPNTLRVALFCALVVLGGATRFIAPLAAEDLPLLPEPAIPLDLAVPSALVPSSAAEASPVTATLAFAVSEIIPDSTFTATVTLTHASGWHTYGPKPGDSGLPTTIDWKLGDGISAGETEWPPTQKFVDRGITTRGYSDTVTFTVPLRADKSLKAGSTVTVGATVRWLACMEACIPGSAIFNYTIPVATEAASSTNAVSSTAGRDATRLLLAILGAFLGGLILNLMPCVLPVLSLKFHSLIIQSNSSRRSSLRNGLAYAFGILISFWVLAAALVALKSGGSAIGWGFQFQDPRFVAVMAAFFMVFALNMLGVFEIGAGAEALADKPVPTEGLPRAFVSGILATVAATPCTAPFMGAAIAYALSASPLAAFLVFGAMGAGLASPIVVLSAFPALTSRLPKPGRWMETLKQALGFFLLLTVLWLLSILSSLAGTHSLIPVLTSLLGTGAAAWIWGRWGNADSPARVRIAGRFVAAIIFAASLAVAVLGTSSAGDRASEIRTDAIGTTETAGATDTADAQAGLPWQDWSPELLADLCAEGKTVFVDFRADWCLSCVANEVTVLNRRAVVDEFSRRGIVALRADWTRSDPVITNALASYGRSSVPLYLLFKPGLDEPIILPEILTVTTILKALETE